MIKFFFLITITIVSILYSSRPVQAQGTSGVKFGIIGDSNSDEYRANDNRAGGTQWEATTLVWNELLQKYKGFNIGPWGCRSEPRRCGFEYNWARSGARSADFTNNGQHTGLAQQVASGQVEYVYIQASENDFHTWNGTYAEVYNGTLSGTALQQKINSIIQVYRTSVETLQNAGSVKIVIQTFNDKSLDPQIAIQFPDATKRQRVNSAIATINQAIRALAQEKNIGILDIDQFTQTEYYPRLNTQTGTLRIGNVDLIMLSRGNDPRYLQLDDGVGHVGTAAGGLYANGVIRAFNAKYATGWTEFTDQQILQMAGLAPSNSTPSPSPTATPSSCGTDINGDQVTDLTDYSILVANFLKQPIANPKADINKDGAVDISDYSLLVAQFLKNC